MLPEKGGVDTLKDIMERKPHPSVIMISAVADAEIAKGTIRLGAFDYLLKPIDLVASKDSSGRALPCLKPKADDGAHRLRPINCYPVLSTYVSACAVAVPFLTR